MNNGLLEGKRTMFNRIVAIPLHHEYERDSKSWATSQHMFHYMDELFLPNKEQGFSLGLRPRFDSHMNPVKKCMLG